MYKSSSSKLGALAGLQINELHPDALLRIAPTSGGQSHTSGDDYVEGAPELIVEIAASSVSRDLYDKLRVYRRSGVQEYVVWRTRDAAKSKRNARTPGLRGTISARGNRPVERARRVGDLHSHTADL